MVVRAARVRTVDPVLPGPQPWPQQDVVGGEGEQQDGGAADEHPADRVDQRDGEGQHEAERRCGDDLTGPGRPPARTQLVTGGCEAAGDA